MNEDTEIKIQDLAGLSTTAWIAHRFKVSGYVLARNNSAYDTYISFDAGATYLTIEAGRRYELNKHLFDERFWLKGANAGSTLRLLTGSKPWGTSEVLNDLIDAVAGLTISPVYASGNMVSETRDTAQTGSATITKDMTTCGLGWGSGFSFITDALVQVEIELSGTTPTTAVFRVSANTAFSFPPGPLPVKIDHVHITDLSGSTWHIDFVGY